MDCVSLLQNKVIQPSNGTSVNRLAIIPIIITSQGHLFENYTMVSEIHGDIDWVSGVNNFVYLEEELNMRELKFKFLNRSAAVFPIHKEMAYPKERRFLKVDTPF